MKLVVKCCCCGLELNSIDVDLDESVVRAETWWTRQPCGPCERQLAREDLERAYRQGGEDAIAGFLALGAADIPINVVHLE